jgi:translation initiation factor 3 subunit E
MASTLTYDLTNTLAPFLDRHLVFPLLEFLQKGRCDEKQIQQAKLELLSKTNMLDFAADTYEALTKDHTSPGAWWRTL